MSCVNVCVGLCVIHTCVCVFVYLRDDVYVRVYVSVFDCVFMFGGVVLCGCVCKCV